MSKFSREEAKRLLELLEQETGIFERVLKLTESQTAFVNAEDMDALNESLDQRQGFIEEIDGLHQETQVLMQSYISYSSSSSGKKLAALDAAEAKLRGLIEACSELNEKNNVLAKEKAGNIAQRIGKLSTSRKSINSYIQGVAGGSELFDKMT